MIDDANIRYEEIRQEKKVEFESLAEAQEYQKKHGGMVIKEAGENIWRVFPIHVTKAVSTTEAD